MPLVQTQSGNPKIQRGQPGYFEAASVVPMLEKPARVDRSMGDVHAAGNPHIHLDPRNIARVAQALGERMAALDPSNKNEYETKTRNFLERWREATARWEKLAAPLRGVPLVVYHKNMTYMIQWLGMREVANLEPKPGLPPSTGHLTELLARLQREPAKAIVRSAYNDPRPGEWLAERAKIPSIAIAFTVGGTPQAKDLFSLYDDTLERLLAAAK
jgi:zinc/manganese transport system substrate-binding protein